MVKHCSEECFYPKTLMSAKFPHLSSIRHFPSRTLQLTLKSSNNLMHFLSCWQTERAWLQVGSASTGYGSFSARNDKRQGQSSAETSDSQKWLSPGTPTCVVWQKLTKRFGDIFRLCHQSDCSASNENYLCLPAKTARVQKDARYQLWVLKLLSQDRGLFQIQFSRKYP